MRNEENIGHIVRDKRAITKENIWFLLIQHLSRNKNTKINFFL